MPLQGLRLIVYSRFDSPVIPHSMVDICNTVGDGVPASIYVYNESGAGFSGNHYTPLWHMPRQTTAQPDENVNSWAGRLRSTTKTTDESSNLCSSDNERDESDVGYAFSDHEPGEQRDPNVHSCGGTLRSTTTDESSNLCSSDNETDESDVGDAVSDHEPAEQPDPNATGDGTAVQADAAQEIDEFSDVSDNSDLFHVEVDAERSYITAEDRDLEVISTLAQHLRPYPLLPPKLPDEADPAEDYTDVSSGARFPTCHCAFKGCTAVTNEIFEDQHWGMEKWLFDHLMEKHAHNEMQEIFRSRCSNPADIFEMTLLAYYMAAVSERERAHLPLLGPSIDRRSLKFAHQACQSKNVDAQMCFTCGQIYTHVRCWDRAWRVHPGKRKWAENAYCDHSAGQIKLYKIKNSLMQLLAPKQPGDEEDAGKRRDIYNKNLLKKEFIARFANDANGSQARHGRMQRNSRMEIGNGNSK